MPTSNLKLNDGIEPRLSAQTLEQTFWLECLGLGHHIYPCLYIVPLQTLAAHS